MNDDMQQNGPRLPDELFLQWQHRSSEEQAELEKVWQLAGTARSLEDPKLDEAAEQLLSALNHADEADSRRRHASLAIRPIRFRQPRQAEKHRAALGRATVFAVGLVLVVAGCAVWFFLLNRSGASPDGMAGAPPMPQFILLLHGDPSYADSPNAQEAVVAEYVAWARELEQANRYVAGDELAAAGRFLMQEDGRLTERTFMSAPAAVSGYFIITAANEDEAVRIASACPHLRRGGTVELRRIIQH